MLDPVEARLSDVLLCFDRTVLELFDRSPAGSARYHREFMPKLQIDNGILTLIHPDKTYNVFGFSPEQQPALEQLTAAVAALGND
jgi:hypothetical protein